MTITPADALLALTPLVEALEKLGVPYYLGGSVASSAYGTARSTLDVDLVADLAEEHVIPLVEALSDEFYIDAKMISGAIAGKSCFNIIHLSTMVKLDIFAVKDRPYDRVALGRIGSEFLHASSESARKFPFASCEDIILNKLEWYRLGEEVSERQWHDVLGVMNVQGDTLDNSYLDTWAAGLGLTDLLERVRRESNVMRKGGK
jgi:hypothetical protein